MTLNQAYLVVGILVGVVTILGVIFAPMLRALVRMAKAWQQLQDAQSDVAEDLDRLTLRVDALEDRERYALRNPQGRRGLSRRE